jgi:hypothetical protein
VPSSRFSISKGGWTRLLTGSEVVYLRFLPNTAGRWVVREIFIDGNDSDGSITAATLRELPISELEAAINGDPEAIRSLTAHLESSSPPSGPSDAPSNVAVLCSFYSAAGGPTTGEAPNWVQMASMARRGDSPSISRRMYSDNAKPLALEDDFCLTKIPESLSEEFLRELSRAYRAAVVRGEAPNVAIAEGTGAPVRTVQRWVYEARKRGIMPPARAKGARG